MTYQLFLGDYAYSSWSLRGWLLFEKFDIPRDQIMVDFSAGTVIDQLPNCAPARTVPTLITPEGAVVSDSLAIAEELASRHPEAGLWPSSAKARATARSLAAEMHAGFVALRSECPMNLRISYLDASPSQDLLADLARLEAIWAHARATNQTTGPWLFGSYSIADAMFAPVAARIAGYNLPVDQHAMDYVNAHLSDPAFRRWRAMGMVHGATLPWYAMDHAQRPWPGPAPRKAVALANGTPENAKCPYSGNPSTHFMEMEGRIFGMCNAFCRDKTVSDPEAWPAFMALV